MRNTVRRSAWLPLLALAFCACVTVESPAMGRISVKGLSRLQASRDFVEGALAARRCTGERIKDAKVRGAGFELTDEKGKVARFAFGEVPSKSFLPPPWFTDHYALPGFELCWSARMGVGGPEEQLFMNALTFFQRDAKEHPAAYVDAPAFDEVVKAYRAAGGRQELPEEARRYQVQAFAAVDDARFGEAAEAFQRALDLAPWWPQGHFNLSLTRAALDDYPGAVDAMGRYLKLEPSAPDSREAQAKIYEWEGKAQRAPRAPVAN